MLQDTAGNIATLFGPWTHSTMQTFIMENHLEGKAGTRPFQIEWPLKMRSISISLHKLMRYLNHVWPSSVSFSTFASIYLLRKKLDIE